MSDCVVSWSTGISAAATVGILWLTLLNYRIYQKTVKSQEENEQRFADLLQAIVVSNMTQQSGGAISVSIENFQCHYKGKTKIFS